MKPTHLFFFVLIFQTVFQSENSFSEMRQPRPVLIIESETNGIIWQSIVDLLWHEGTLYVLDNSLSQAHVVTEDGNYIGLLAGEGDGPGDLRNPSSISINGNGNIVVCSKMFGKCEEFDSESKTLLRSFTLHSLESEAICHVFRVEWKNEWRYEHYLFQKIEGTNVIRETRISKFESDGKEHVLYKHQSERNWKELNERAEVPFTKEAWGVDKKGLLWCAENWEKPVLTNPLTGQEKILGSYRPRRRSKVEIQKITNELKQYGGIEKIDLWPTKRAVLAIEFDSGMCMLGEAEKGEIESYILCGSNVPGGQISIQKPIIEKENKVYLLGNHLIAFVYDEAMEYESSWGETIQGPCIVVVSYEGSGL